MYYLNITNPKYINHIKLAKTDHTIKEYNTFCFVENSLFPVLLYSFNSPISARKNEKIDAANTKNTVPKNCFILLNFKNYVFLHI